MSCVNDFYKCDLQRLTTYVFGVQCTPVALNLFVVLVKKEGEKQSPAISNLPMPSEYYIQFEKGHNDQHLGSGIFTQ